jgi:hypothetical protein
MKIPLQDIEHYGQSKIDPLFNVQKHFDGILQSGLLILS